MTFNTFDCRSNSGRLTSTFHAEKSERAEKLALPSLPRHLVSAGSHLEAWLKQRGYVRLKTRYDGVVDNPDNRPQHEW